MGGAFNPDTAAVGFDDAASDGEAEAGAASFEFVAPGGVEGQFTRLEEFFKDEVVVGGDKVLDQVFLAQVDRQITRFIRGAVSSPEIVALGVVETDTVSATIRGADAALKAAETRLVALMLGRGIAGKGVFAFSGELHDVQASLEESLYACRAEHVLNTEEIAAPHAGMTLRMLGLGSQGPFY